MLILAGEIFPDHNDVCLVIAMRAAENTWQNGLLKKGNSLCHGIAGNGYLMHCLSRAFWREAAL